MTSSPQVIAIFGPTASGKSAVAELVASRLGTEVVSADAMQVYRGLPILTNQPVSPTLLVGIKDLGEQMSVGAFAKLAHTAVDALVDRNGAAVVSGGTGLYLRAALVDMEVPGPPREGERARLEASYDADPAGAHARLAELDSRAAMAVHPNDRRRVVRALELAEAGSSLVANVDRLWSEEFRRPTIVFGLELPRDVLERRIRSRTEEMFRRGVVEEVRTARRGVVSRTAEKALGVAELSELSPEEAAARIVVRTNRYAAYQRKWMRRIPGIVMIDGDRTPTEVADAILEVAGTR